MALSGLVTAFVLPVSLLTGSWVKLGRGRVCVIVLRLYPPTNSPPLTLAWLAVLYGGPAEVRWPLAIPAVCRVSWAISVTPRGPSENQCANKSERERDNHTFYMLHLAFTGVAFRLDAKCDLDGESTN